MKGKWVAVGVVVIAAFGTAFWAGRTSKPNVVHIQADGNESKAPSQKDIEAAKAHDRLGRLRSPLLNYQRTVGRPPSTEEGLLSLTKSRWLPKIRDGYSERDVSDSFVSPDDLMDLWGREIRYASPGKRHPDSYDLWSVGPDGVDGSDDDVCYY